MTMDPDLQLWGAVNHDAVMAAIADRAAWIHDETDRRFCHMITGLIVAAAPGIWGATQHASPTGIMGLAASAVACIGVLAAFTNAPGPDQLRQRWNDQHAIGAYLSSLDDGRHPHPTKDAPR